MNGKGLIFCLVAPGPFQTSEQTFEQSHPPLTIISSTPNFLHFVNQAKKYLNELFNCCQLIL